jgi:hypothetical protein
MREDFQLNCWQFLKSAPGCKTIVREPAAYRQTIRDDSVRFENCLPKNRFATIICPSFGGIAQLVERLVRNEKARGSNPLTSSLRCSCLRRQNSYSHRRYRCLDERGDRTGSAGKTKVIVITAKRDLAARCCNARWPFSRNRSTTRNSRNCPRCLGSCISPLGEDDAASEILARKK